MEPQTPNQSNGLGEQPVISQVPEPSPNTTQPLQGVVNVTPQATPPNPLHHKSSQLTERAERLKKLSIMVMIAGLIGAAIVAVVAVLAGSFNHTFAKALITLLLVIFHALACLGFVEQAGKSQKSSFKFFENAVFSIIVLSFFTSIFGVWGLLDGSIVGKLYGTYFVLLFACLHGQMLVETRGEQASIDTMVTVNYVVMSLVILLILPLIWLTENHLPGFYYRLLAACGIIDGTLTILAVILSRLYLQKHPKAQSAIFSIDSHGQPIPTQAIVQKRRIHPLMWLLGIFLAAQLVISLLFAALGAFYR